MSLLFLRCQSRRSFSNDGAKVVIISDMCKFFFSFDEKLKIFITNASFNQYVFARRYTRRAPYLKSRSGDELFVFVFKE